MFVLPSHGLAPPPLALASWSRWWRWLAAGTPQRRSRAASPELPATPLLACETPQCCPALGPRAPQPEAEMHRGAKPQPHPPLHLGKSLLLRGRPLPEPQRWYSTGAKLPDHIIGEHTETCCTNIVGCKQAYILTLWSCIAKQHQLYYER